MEEQLTAGLGEGEVAELVEDDEVHAAEVVGDAALAAGTGFGLEPVDEVDDIEEAAPCASADAGGAMPTAMWVLPVPVPPISTRLRC